MTANFQQIPVPRATLYCESAGNGPPLVVLHGGPGLGSAYLTQELISLLGNTACLVFFDQRGSGRSDGVNDHARLNIRQFVEDVHGVRSFLGLPRLRLLGHSFGGLLAMHYAIAYPDHVAGLILVDSDPASRRLWAMHKRRSRPAGGNPEQHSCVVQRSVALPTD